MWPIEDRPEAMKNPAVVNSMTLQSLFSFKEHFELLQKKEGKGDSTFGSDRKLPARTYSEREDDATGLLHPIRFDRGPVVELEDYWAQMPKKRSPTYRHLPLEHAGLANHVNECVIVRAHDRTLPLRLRMFTRGNQTKKGFLNKEGEGKEPAESWEYPKAVLDIQMAVSVFGEVYANLWPQDPTPRLLGRLLIEYEYAANSADNERERCR